MNTTNTISTLLGAAELTVRLQDGSTEYVRVKQLPVKAYQELLKRQGDEVAQIELYCEHRLTPEEPWTPATRDWAESLMPDGHQAIIVKAEELNADFFGAWVRRQMSRMERLNPGLAEKLFAGVAGGAPKTALPSSAPKSPSSAA
jgi:hypothetical protein